MLDRFKKIAVNAYRFVQLIGIKIKIFKIVFMGSIPVWSILTVSIEKLLIKFR